MSESTRETDQIMGLPLINIPVLVVLTFRYEVNGFSISFEPTTHFRSWNCVQPSVDDVGLAWVAIAGSLKLDLISS